MGPFEVLLFSKAKQRNTFIIQLRPPVLRRGFGALRGAQRRSSQTATPPPALLGIPLCCATLTAPPRAPCPLLGSPGLGPPFFGAQGLPTASPGLELGVGAASEHPQGERGPSVARVGANVTEHPSQTTLVSPAAPSPHSGYASLVQQNKFCGAIKRH